MLRPRGAHRLEDRDVLALLHHHHDQRRQHGERGDEHDQQQDDRSTPSSAASARRRDSDSPPSSRARGSRRRACRRAARRRDSPDRGRAPCTSMPVTEPCPCRRAAAHRRVHVGERRCRTRACPSRSRRPPRSADARHAGGAGGRRGDAHRVADVHPQLLRQLGAEDDAGQLRRWRRGPRRAARRRCGEVDDLAALRWPARSRLAPAPSGGMPRTSTPANSRRRQHELAVDERLGAGDLRHGARRLHDAGGVADRAELAPDRRRAG